MVQDSSVAAGPSAASSGTLADSLALWLQGMLLAENGCLDRVVAALAVCGDNVHTL